MLTGCRKQDTLVVMVPQGSPELGVTYLKNDSKYQVDVVLGADPLLAAFSSKTHDVIIAPTHLGARLYASNSNYKMLGVLVFGNYYVVSRSIQLNTLHDLNHQEVIVFGMNQTSDIIVKYLLDYYHVETNITYVDTIATANSMLILNPNLIILTAEPSLSTLNQLYLDLSILSIEPYYHHIQGETYPQASVFVKSDLPLQTLKMIEKDLIEATKKLNENVESSANLAIRLGLDMKKEVLMDAIPRSNIHYLNAFEAKPMIEKYFLMIHQLNPMFLSDPILDDQFYFQGEK